jgi:hypothetical protein
LALLVEPVTEAANLNACRGINATDGVLNSALLKLGDILFICHVL